MKLKKILASLTAAAMAVTTMAIAPVSVSAAGTDKPEGTETVLATIKAATDELDFEASAWVDNYSLDATWFEGDENYVKVTFNCETAPTFGNGNDPMSTVANWGWDTYSGWLNVGKFYGGTITADTLLIPATNSTDNEIYCYLPLSDFTAGTQIQGLVQSYLPVTTTAKVEIVSIPTEPAPFEGNIITLSRNEWSENGVDYWNWQGAQLVEQTQFTKDMGMDEVYEKASTVKVSLKVNGATAGTNLNYDPSQISWQMQIKFHNGDDWPWIVGGTSTYENGVVTISADLATLLGKTYSTSAYLFDTINIIPAAANTSADDTIKVYYQDMTVSLVKTVPATAITIDPAELELEVGKSAFVSAEVSPADTTDEVVFTSSDPTVATVGAASGEVTAVAEGTATITATAGEKTATCEVTVLPDTYPITVTTNDETMGTASAKVAEAKEGELVTLTPVAKTGYKFVEWIAPEGVTISKDNTFVMPAKAVTVKAVFAVKEADEFDIVIDKNIENGTVAVTGGTTAAKAGDTVTLSITPDMGCEFVSLTVNGEAIEGNSFTMPAEDVAISAVFKKIDYKITIKPDECGTITVDKETAQYGDTVTVKIVPNEGYIVHAVYVNGEAIEGTTFKMPAEDVEIFGGYETEGSIETEGGTSPSGITISFEDNNDAVLEAVFGEDWADRYAISDNLSVKMEVLDEVPAEDKTAVEDYLSDNQYLGVILDINLIKTVNSTSTAVTECSKPISFRIDVPDDIIAEDRIYSVVRVHDGKAENIGGTFDSESKTITVSSDKFSTYAIVYDEASVEEPVPEPDVEPVVYYSITSDRNVRTSLSSACAGTTVTVNVDFGYDAIVYCGGTRIARITDRGTFVMPAGNVRIVTEANGYLAMIKKAAPNSYIFVYDSEMNHIKTNGSRKGIVGEGTITVKLGEEYAGMTVTLYKGRKSTAVELDSAVLDADGNATFTVEGGKNYTAVVE